MCANGQVKVELVAYNPEVRKRSYEKMKDRALTYSKWYSLKRKFNLTQEEYQQLEQKQNYKCAICSGKCSRSLAVDHDHSTGKIRGLLCSGCNRGIGYLKDDISILKKAIDYLERASISSV